MKALDALYDGELYPSEQVVSKDPEYRKVVKESDRLMEKLEKELSGEQFGEINKICDLLSDAQGMEVCGMDKTYIAGLIGGNRFVFYEVYRDESMIEELLAAEVRFWNDNVLADRCPEMDGSAATTTFLNEKYGQTVPDCITLPEQMKEVLEKKTTVTKTGKSSGNSQKTSETNTEKAPNKTTAAMKGLSLAQTAELERELKRTGVSIQIVLDRYSLPSMEQMTEDIYEGAMRALRRTGSKNQRATQKTA